MLDYHPYTSDYTWPWNRTIHHAIIDSDLAFRHALTTLSTYFRRTWFQDPGLKSTFHDYHSSAFPPRTSSHFTRLWPWVSLHSVHPPRISWPDLNHPESDDYANLHEAYPWHEPLHMIFWDFSDRSKAIQKYISTKIQFRAMKSKSPSDKKDKKTSGSQKTRNHGPISKVRRPRDQGCNFPCYMSMTSISYIFAGLCL